MWTGQLLYAENVKGLEVIDCEVGGHGMFSATLSALSLPGVHLKNCENPYISGGSFAGLRKEALLLEGSMAGVINPGIIRNVAQEGASTPIIRLLDSTLLSISPGFVWQESSSYGQTLIKEEGASSYNTGSLPAAVYGVGTLTTLIGAGSGFARLGPAQTAQAQFAGTETLIETQVWLNTLRNQLIAAGVLKT